MKRNSTLSAGLRVLASFALLGVISAAPACSSNSDGNGGGDGGNGGSPATFTEVYSIINGNCVGCHNAALASFNGNLDMSTQPTAYKNLVGIPAAGSSCAGQGTRVVAGSASESLLYIKVSQMPPVCGVRMPAQGTPLTQDQIDQIASWINDQAPNN